MRKSIIENLAKEIVAKDMSIRESTSLKETVWRTQCSRLIKLSDFSFLVELEINKLLK